MSYCESECHFQVSCNRQANEEYHWSTRCIKITTVACSPESVHQNKRHAIQHLEQRRRKLTSSNTYKTQPFQGPTRSDKPQIRIPHRIIDREKKNHELGELQSLYDSLYDCMTHKPSDNATSSQCRPDPTVQSHNDNSVKAENLTGGGTPPCTKGVQTDTSVKRQNNRHFYPSHTYP